MLTLNLDDFSIFKYPGGEVQTRLVQGLGVTEVNLHARVRSSDDLIALFQAGDIINNAGASINQLVLPYLPYGRADRRFVPGDTNGLQVMLKAISSLLQYKQVLTIDIHSKTPDILNVEPTSFIQRTINQFKPTRLVFPDKGARQRYDIAHIPSTYCEKVRTPGTGDIIGFARCGSVNEHDRILVIDDICDGGRTFLEVAKTIPDTCILGLYITHGLFSKGVRELLSKYETIFTTNTFQKHIAASNHGTAKNVVVFDYNELLGED